MRNYAPAGRTLWNVSDPAETPRRLAAVVMPIFANPPHEVVFIERARHLRRHAGQIAFPGGALDEADGGDHARAALRELNEEIGIPPAAVTIVGRLEDIHQRRFGFTVTPFVGIVAPGTPLVVDLNEAAAAHHVPLAAIVAPGAVHTAIEVLPERQVETPVFDYGPLHVWGLTGLILRTFVERYHAESQLRAALDAQLQH
jgi:8-oxo-dGTP pyrophosphatase MutT (NUDIX family)